MAFQSVAAPKCNYEGSFLVLHLQSASFGVDVNIWSIILVVYESKQAGVKEDLPLRLLSII